MRTWAHAAGVRAVKTVAQTAVATIGTDFVGILDVPWEAVLSASLMAGVLSLLMSIQGLPEVEQDATPPDPDYTFRHRG